MNSSLLACLAVPALAAPLAAQTFPAAGQTVELAFTGQPVDYLIPTVGAPGSISIDLQGGEGGGAFAEVNCSYEGGGRAARVVATFPVGTGSSDLLQPGGELRFLVGEAGESAEPYEGFTLGFRHSSGGGGGGTGVLYLAPGSTDWEPLAVAGGGGGGVAGMTFGFCHKNSSGRDASLVPSGADGADNPYDNYGGTDGFSGGQNGAGGDGGSQGFYSSGGGGFYGDALDLGSVVTDPAELVRIGKAGYPAGAPGGIPDDDEVLDNEGRGGWGCGSGGAGHAAYNAGGGGGGWSGGGAGGASWNLTGGAGGGGGTWVDPRSVGPVVVTHAVSQKAKMSEPDDGKISFTPSAFTDGDFCGQAIEIFAPLTQLHWQELVAKGGATPSVTSSCLGLSPIADRWYTYVNELPVSREVLFSSFDGPMRVEHFDACGGSSLGCGSAWEPTATLTARFLLQPGERGYFRVEKQELGFAQDSGFGIQMTAKGPDADGDTVVDILDNCIDDWNVQQYDFDGDGVGNACDICPGGDDSLDSDGDGVPDFCDQCPGSDDFADLDGDGVPDACDTCLGDNSADADGDGIPDACDPCFGPAGDCDGNNIGDSCDLTQPARLSTFELDAYDPDVIDVDNGGFTPTIGDGTLRIMDSDVDAIGNAFFAPVSPIATTSYEVEFWLRMDPTTVIDPLSFHIFDESKLPDDFALSPAGIANSYADLQVDIGNVFVPGYLRLRWDNQLIAGPSMPFTWNDGVWRKLRIVVDGGMLTLSVQELGQAAVTYVSEATIPSFDSIVPAYGFSTRAYFGLPEQVTYSVDQLLFRDLSGNFDRDMDGDQVLDSCQHPATQAVRLGAPANPEALAMPTGDGPGMGGTYSLSIDHTTFFPTAQSDFLLISVVQGNIPLPPYGTVLGSFVPTIQFQQAAGSSFDVPIPVSAALLNAPLTFQGATADFAVPLPGGGTTFGFGLTNAIDTTIGAWSAGF